VLTDPPQVAAAAGILILAYGIRGVTGFGSALVAVPLLVQFLPISFVVPWIVGLDVLAALLLSTAGWGKRDVDWAEVRWLLPSAGLGIALGLILLVRLPHTWLALLLGVFVSLFGIRTLLRLHGETPVSRWWAVPAGALGGAVGALFAAGGPPFVIYLSHRIRDKSRLRSTLSTLFLIEGGVRLGTMVAAGLLDQQGMWQALALGVATMISGLYLGHRVHLNLSHRQVLRLIGGLLTVSGTALIWRFL
jgi:uncharacterized membrane protein YfcA